MKIVAIYATGRKDKSSTYNIAQHFIKRLAGPDPVTEFFLPKAMPHFCLCCWQCFTDYTRCPHYSELKPMVDAMLEAQLLIFTAPVYVFHVPGQLKAFLDHFGYQWMVHQPRPEMFGKQALLISTAAGGGTRSTLKDLKDSMTFWGVARTYTFGVNVRSSDWGTVKDSRKEKILREADTLANRIAGASTHVTPSLKVKGLFYAMRFMHKKNGFNPADVAYWERNGWLGKLRPWRQRTN